MLRFHHRVEFEITATARTLRPVFDAVLKWATEHPASPKQTSRKPAAANDIEQKVNRAQG